MEVRNFTYAKSVDEADAVESLKVRLAPRKGIVIFKCHWLIKIVSSIRRIANRKRLANNPCMDPWIDYFDALSKHNYQTVVDTITVALVREATCRIILRGCQEATLALLDKVSRYWDYLRRNAFMESLDRDARPASSMDDITKTTAVVQPVYRYRVMDVVAGRFGEFSRLRSGCKTDRFEVRKRERGAIILFSPKLRSSQLVSVQDSSSTRDACETSQFASTCAMSPSPRPRMLQSKGTATSVALAHWQQEQQQKELQQEQRQRHQDVEPEKSSRREAQGQNVSNATPPRSCDDDSYAIDAMTILSCDEYNDHKEKLRHDNVETSSSSDCNNDRDVEGQRAHSKISPPVTTPANGVQQEEHAKAAMQEHRECLENSPSLDYFDAKQDVGRLIGEYLLQEKSKGRRDSTASLGDKSENDVFERNETRVSKRLRLSQGGVSQQENLAQEKSNATSLLERFGLLSSGDEEEANSDVSTTSDPRSHQHRGLAPPNNWAAADGCPITKRLNRPCPEHTLEKGHSRDVSGTFLPGQQEQSETFDADRNSPQPKTPPSVNQSTHHTIGHRNSRFNAMNSTEAEQDSSPEQFPISSPVSSYGKEDAEFTHSNSQAFSHAKDREGSPTQLIMKRDKKRKRKEEKATRKMARKEEKRRRRKAKKNESNKVEKHLEDEELETPRRLDMEDSSPIGHRSKAQTVNGADERTSFSRQVTTDPDSIYCANERRINHAPEKLDRVGLNISPRGTSLEILEGLGTEVEGAATRTEASSIPRESGQSSNDVSPDNQVEDQIAPIRVLCSESFFENFGEVVVELSNDRWQENRKAPLNQPIHFIDSSLIDFVGVDIETPHQGAIIVVATSQIKREGLSKILPELMELCAAARYQHLDIFISVDINLDVSASHEIARLHSATLRHEGHPSTDVTIRTTSKAALPGCIAETLLIGNTTSHISENMEGWLSGERTREHMRFLISLLPTLSLTGALHWLNLSVEYVAHSPEEDDELISLRWFQWIFCDVDKAINHLDPTLGSNSLILNTMNPNVAYQLKIAARARWN